MKNLLNLNSASLLKTTLSFLNSQFLRAIFLAILAAAGVPRARAQTLESYVFNIGGGSFSNSTFSSDYSIGEMLFQTYTTSSIILTQGFLQPESKKAIGIKEQLKTGSLVIFPNPFSDKIWIQSENYKIERIVIYSMTGSQVYDNSWSTEPIELGQFNPGFYLILIYGMGDEPLHSFKILKD